MLRKYQQECMEKISDFIIYSQKRNGIVVAATGTGKSVVIRNVVESFPRLRILVCAHRRELLDQLLGHLSAIQNDVQVVCQNNVDASKRVHIASISSLVTCKKRYEELRPNLIVIDECHRSETNQYRKLFAHNEQAKVIGFTATPLRSSCESQEMFNDFWGEPIYSYPYAEAMNQGFLVPFNFHLFEEKVDLSVVKSNKSDFDEKALAGAVDNDERNSAIVAHHIRLGVRKAIAFCSSIKHCTSVCLEYVSKTEVPVFVLTSETSKDERKNIIDEYRRLSRAILINCAILTEGFDAPETDQIIMFTATKSPGKYIQCIGRGTRLFPGKKECTVIDSNSAITTCAAVLDVLQSGKHHREAIESYFCFSDGKKLWNDPMSKLGCQKKLWQELKAAGVFSEEKERDFLCSKNWHKSIFLYREKYYESVSYADTGIYVGRIKDPREEKQGAGNRKKLLFAGNKTIEEILQENLLRASAGKAEWTKFKKKYIYAQSRNNVYIAYDFKNNLVRFEVKKEDGANGFNVYAPGEYEGGAFFTDFVHVENFLHNFCTKRGIEAKWSRKWCLKNPYLSAAQAKIAPQDVNTKEELNEYFLERKLRYE